MIDLRPARPALWFSIAIAALWIGVVSGWRPAVAAESEAVTRARENVAYEHAHLGVIGTLFCKRSVEWMDERMASFDSGKNADDSGLAGDYVKTAIEDVRQCEDSHTVDVEVISGIVLFVAGVVFLFVLRRKRRLAV